MTVGELVALLSHFPDDSTIAIPCTPPFSSIGPAARVHIETVYAGFDWNQGTAFLKPSEALYTKLEKLRHASKAFEDIAGWYHARESKISGSDPEQFMKIVGNIIASYGKKTS